MFCSMNRRGRLKKLEKVLAERTMQKIVMDRERSHGRLTWIHSHIHRTIQTTEQAADLARKYLFTGENSPLSARHSSNIVPASLFTFCQCRAGPETPSRRCIPLPDNSIVQSSSCIEARGVEVSRGIDRAPRTDSARLSKAFEMFQRISIE